MKKEENKSNTSYGVVTQLRYPIATVVGLSHVRPHEVVILETGQLGEIFTIGKDDVEIFLFSQEAPKRGVSVKATGKLISIGVGKELLGGLIDPLGNSISGVVGIPEHEMEIEQEPLGIAGRTRLKKPLTTGVSVVDMLIPIGKGQRELIIGDRKTGKTSFLMSTITYQAMQGDIVIYAMIGKKKSDIKELEAYCDRAGIRKNVIIVASSSFDSPSLIYLTPYTAMTIAEYFRDHGKDTLVVLDDLSTHAKFYREISLLANNFPGRDSYPGDIFHTHAKLLERAGNFVGEHGDVAITCLPVAETVESDLTGYIATNIMSMTDGHIFFDSNIYAQGRRPAVNIPLSVTRVGKQIHTKLQRDINREILAFIGQYDNMQNLSHFGTELSEKIKEILKNGEKVFQFFDQPYDMIIPSNIQLLLFTLLWSGMLEASDISTVRKKLLDKNIEKKVNDIFTKLFNGDSLSEVVNTIKQHEAEVQKLWQ